MTIHVKFALNRYTGFREKKTFSQKGPMLKLYPLMATVLNCRSSKKHNFRRGPSNDHSYNVFFELVCWFQRRIF